MADVTRPPESGPPPVALWRVWRIDDNGNTFLMRECLSKEEADRTVAEFTARGHKQTYWAEQQQS